MMDNYDYNSATYLKNVYHMIKNHPTALFQPTPDKSDKANMTEHDRPNVSAMFFIDSVECVMSIAGQSVGV